MRVNREALREYASGSLWLFPSVSGAIALVLGWVVSGFNIGPQSPWALFAFHGTADDARALLIAVTGTVVTVIALVLGLTVVALQLSSTQFSPRLLRNFIRDRPNQLVLSVFSATFAYSAAGLYTVGVSSGARIESYPRLAVTGARTVFATLAMVIYFADHLMHSIQIDAIAQRVERDTLLVARSRLGQAEERTPAPPHWAVPLRSTRSGYVQQVHRERLLAVARRERVTLCLRPRVGEHVVAGTTLAWVWRAASADARPDPAALTQDLDAGVGIAFERMLERTRHSVSVNSLIWQSLVPGSGRSLHGDPSHRPHGSDLLHPRRPSGRRLPRHVLVAIVHSEHDEFIKREHAEYLARSIPGASRLPLRLPLPLRNRRASGSVVLWWVAFERFWP